MKERRPIARGLLLSLLAAAGCGASGEADQPPDNVTVVPLNVNVTVDPDTRYQTMVGFGAAVAFEIGILANQPNRADIYNALYVDGGFQILRIANWYQNSQARGNPNDMGDFNATVSVVSGIRAALGRDPLILLSSWSPPPSMKSVNNFVGGTLGQSNGAFRYADFGQWWRTSLDAYAAAGVVPTYVSIQNEPDFVPTGTTTWSSCLFDPIEDLTRNAGYGPALAAVSDAISDLSPKPTLIGPEVSGIGNSRVENYLQGMAADGALDRLDGVAHHLYNGGSSSLPGTFDFAMRSVASDSGGKPLFQTEFGPSPANMFDTAWLINNAVTVEGVTAYLHWDLTWGESASSPSPSGLISIETAAPARWQTPKGFKINDSYYSVRHYAKWIDVGWQRIGATPDASVIHVAAFASPDGLNETIVLLNSDTAEHLVGLDTGAFTYGTSMIYRTSGTDERTAALGALPAGNVVEMPAKSIVTVTLTP